MVPFLTQPDPTGFSSTTGQLVSLVILLGALVVLLRWWWQQRRK
jgi:phenylalanine-4-hydroxylase